MLKFYTLTDIRHYKHYLYRHNIIVMPHEIIKPNTSHGSNKPLHWDRDNSDIICNDLCLIV